MTIFAAMMGLNKPHLPPVSIDIDQATRVGQCFSMGEDCFASSNIATTTVVDGTPPYTYLWTFVSGDSFIIGTPTADNTAFAKTNDVLGDPSFVGIYKCTVTDDDLVTAEDTVEVTLNFIDTT